MPTDDEFYASILPHLRAKRAGHVEEVTPKDASATRSNGGNHPDRVTEPNPPNGPKLSIIVRYEGSAVPESQRAAHYRPHRKKRSVHREGWALPVVEKDNVLSPVDGVVIIDGVEDKVKLTECKLYRRPDYSGGLHGETVALAMQSLSVETTSYIITFDGHGTIEGTFETKEPQLNECANDWAVRWMLRKEHGR